MGRLEELVANEHENTVSAACIAIAFGIQLPTLNSKQLMAGIKDISEYIAVYAANIREGSGRKES